MSVNADEVSVMAHQPHERMVCESGDKTPAEHAAVGVETLSPRLNWVFMRMAGIR